MYISHYTPSFTRSLWSLSALLWEPQISPTIVYDSLTVNISILRIRPRATCKLLMIVYFLTSWGTIGFSRRSLLYRVTWHYYLTCWLSPLTCAAKSTSIFRIVCLNESCSVSSRSLVWQAPASRLMLWPRRRLRRKLSHVVRAAAMLCCGRRKVPCGYSSYSVALSLVSEDYFIYILGTTLGTLVLCY